MPKSEQSIFILCHGYLYKVDLGNKKMKLALRYRNLKIIVEF